MNSDLAPRTLDPGRIEHSFPFDPTQGCTLSDLMQIGIPDNEPPDFEDFWTNLFTTTSDLSLDLLVFQETGAPAGFRLLRLEYAIGRGFRCSAWLTMPLDVSGIRSGMVVSHGYDGRVGVEGHFYKPGVVVVLPVAPGFSISADPRLPLNDSSRHVVFGIENPQTYILGLCAAAIWRSLDATQIVLGRTLSRWHYYGWSFGGGIGALSIPWDSRIGSAELGHPTFGHHPLRLLQPSTGSSNAVRDYYLQDPTITLTLSYFDAAFAARKLRIPTAFACALFDPAVTPPGQFSVANAHPGPKTITCFLAGHFDVPRHNDLPETLAHRRAVKKLAGAEFTVP